MQPSGRAKAQTASIWQGMVSGITGSHCGFDTSGSPEAALALRSRPIRCGHGSERREKRRLQGSPARDRDGTGESGSGIGSAAGWRSPPIPVVVGGHPQRVSGRPGVVLRVCPQGPAECRQALPFSVTTCQARALVVRLILVAVGGIRPAFSGRGRTECPSNIPVSNGFACPGLP